MGALRYRFPDGPYLDDDDETAAPPWTSLGELEHPEYGRWLAMLLGIDQPWLVADDAAGRWLLFFTVRTADGAHIGRVSGLAGFADGLDLASLVTVAEGDSDHPELEGFTVVGDLAVARAVGSEPGGILVRLERDGPDAWVPVGGTLADARIHGAHPDDLGAMDRDEVADPALVEVDGMVRLLFAGRNGTRWRMGLLVSLAGEDWLQPLGTEPLWESDSGFDALVSRDPAPWADDGMVRMLYVGGDGVTTAVGRGSSGTTGTWPAP